jgi:hypothetical protein
MKLRFARRWITIDSVARLVFLFVFLGLLAFPVETQAKELDHGLSYGTVVSRPTEFFSPGIESCVASIQRGLALMTVSKKNFDETRDYLVSAMAANPEAATDHVLPPNVEAIVAPKKFENVDDLRDFETALEMMKSFKDRIEQADGEAYRKAAAAACAEAKASHRQPNDRFQMSTLMKQSYDIISSSNARALLTVLRINAHWALQRRPSDAEVKQNKTLQDRKEATPQSRIEEAKNAGFDAEELASIREYTSSGYGTINTFLRSHAKEPDQSKELGTVIELLNHSLGKLPNHVGTVRRGGTLPAELLAQHQIGAVVSYPAYTSAATNAGFHADHTFVIQSYTGKYVEKFSVNEGEEEVLFRPDSKFKILHRETNKWGQTTFYMEEVAE